MPFDAAPRLALVPCTVCPVAPRCLLATAGAGPQPALQSLPHPGKTLFAAGDAADAVYVVRAGCLKSFTVDADGNERVRAFHLPGDLLGLDALGAETHASHAAAVVPSQVCRVSMAALRARMAESPELADGVLKRISRRLRDALALSGDYTAEQRVAAFLLQMQERVAALAQDPHAIQLPMTRRDIANHLRLATETVCRVLKRFERSGWLAAQDKRLLVRRPAALAACAAAVGLARQPLPLAA